MTRRVRPLGTSPALCQCRGQVPRFVFSSLTVHPLTLGPCSSSFSASTAQKSLTVSEETEHTMKVTWAPAPGRVSHYRLTFGPSGGAMEAPLKVPGTASSVVMEGLQPLTTYHISVQPIYRHGEGKARQGVGRTRTLVS